jgi:hypothetical protein
MRQSYEAARRQRKVRASTGCSGQAPRKWRNTGCSFRTTGRIGTSRSKQQDTSEVNVDSSDRYQTSPSFSQRPSLSHPQSSTPPARPPSTSHPTREPNSSLYSITTRPKSSSRPLVKSNSQTTHPTSLSKTTPGSGPASSPPYMTV